MSDTDEEGKEFQLNCFKDNIRIAQENYFIKHDGCHIELVSGKTHIQLPD